MITKYPCMSELNVKAYENWEKSSIFNFKEFLGGISNEQKLSLIVLDTDKKIMESGFEHWFNCNGSFMLSLLKMDLKSYDNVIFDAVLDVFEQAKNVYDLKITYGDDLFNKELSRLKKRYETIRPYFLINSENKVRYIN